MLFYNGEKFTSLFYFVIFVLEQTGALIHEGLAAFLLNSILNKRGSLLKNMEIIKGHSLISEELSLFLKA
ncbi:hypothetical protein A8F94_05450 [Bacillus sp. FJAT-27225]|nr:hypothetical protein A8F94_05450 [Bacillus sp. FJAT-27225]